MYGVRALNPCRGRYEHFFYSYPAAPLAWLSMSARAASATERAWFTGPNILAATHAPSMLALVGTLVLNDRLKLFLQRPRPGFD